MSWGAGIDEDELKRNNEKELDENSTCANFAQVADNGKTYNYKIKCTMQSME